MSKSNKNKQTKTVDTIEVPVEAKTETAPTRTELIQKYRDLGKDMTALRDAHILEKEACIAKYKAAKEEIRKQREVLLAEIRKPKAKTETEEQTEGPTDAELAEIEADIADAEVA